MTSIEHRAREVVEEFMARVRSDLDTHLNALTFDLLQLMRDGQDSWRVELERAVKDARADAERTLRAELEAVPREMRLEAESADTPDMGSAPADAEEGQPAAGADGRRVDTLARLLGAVRRLDEATSLSGTLEALAHAAAAETSRVAILIVDGDLLRVWGHYGFASSGAPEDTPLAQAGVLAAAIDRREASRVAPLLDASDPRVHAGQTGLAVPIIVGSEVVALLYADDVDRLAGQEGAPIWTEEVELLVRHASLRLENVTSARTVEVLTKPA